MSASILVLPRGPSPADSRCWRSREHMGTPGLIDAAQVQERQPIESFRIDHLIAEELLVLGPRVSGSIAVRMRDSLRISGQPNRFSACFGDRVALPVAREYREDLLASPWGTILGLEQGPRHTNVGNIVRCGLGRGQREREDEGRSLEPRGGGNACVNRIFAKSSANACQGLPAAGLTSFAPPGSPKPCSTSSQGPRAWHSRGWSIRIQRRWHVGAFPRYRGACEVGSE